MKEQAMYQCNARASLKPGKSRSERDDTPVCEFYSFTVGDDTVRVAGALTRAECGSSDDCGPETVRNAIQGRAACLAGVRHAD